MTYETFKEEALESLESSNCAIEHEQTVAYIYGRNKFPDRMLVYWETGGVSGGSCWDDSDPQSYTSSDPEAELKSLDAIIEHFKEDMSFIQYRKLYNELVSVDSYCDREYYGNETDYNYKHYNLKELYNYFVEKEWLK